jgi:hypothetical protein
MIAEQPEQMFSDEIIEQREKVEKESIVLQTLVDTQLEDTTTLFMWCSNKKKIIITDNLFRKKRRLRLVDNNDEEEDDDDEQGYVKFKFDLEGPQNPKSSLPKKTMTFELERTSESEDVPHNSHMPHQIHIQKIGEKKHVPDNDVWDKVILEVEGSASSPTFVPYNYVHHHIKMHKARKVAHDDDDASDNDVQRSQTPERVSWGSKSPKIP